MNYYEEIKIKLIDEEVYAKVKDYSKERHRVITYYEIGRLLHEAGKNYGDNIIGDYAKKLSSEVGKKYTRSTLFRMKQFYNVFSDEKVAAARRLLTSTHYKTLLPLNNTDKILYYVNLVVNNNLTVKQLREKIKSKEYERLPKETINKIINEEKLEIKDLIPNPIIIKNNSNKEIITEKELHLSIMDDIENFLKGLGNSFSFIGSEYKIKIGSSYNYIDLLLFNIEYNCYAVVELKVTELKKEHIGQIEIYMNYIIPI